MGPTKTRQQLAKDHHNYPLVIYFENVYGEKINIRNSLYVQAFQFLLANMSMFINAKSQIKKKKNSQINCLFHCNYDNEIRRGVYE